MFMLPRGVKNTDSKKTLKADLYQYARPSIAMSDVVDANMFYVEDETPATTSSASAAPSLQNRPSSASGSTKPIIEISVARLAEIESRLEVLTDAVRSTRMLGVACANPFDLY